MRLISLKTRRVGMRNVRAGEVFEISPAYGRVMIKLGHAELAPAPAPTRSAAPKAPAKVEEPKRTVKAEVEPAAPVEQVAVDEAPAEDERAVLRREYEEKFGKKPYMGWTADQLREKLTAE